jgi:CCR4-NOT transcription complex subunit 4
MNGLCPACRRPYNDKDIEYKVITPEETAIHRARQVQKQKKNLQAQLKEKAKAEADSLSRKHLAGLRVVQKNLVYVTGLSPKLQEEELLHTLRGDTYFGQYGKIIKIVVSKARDRLDSVGVYVTYENKSDAESCIKAVDGSPNGDRTLRAQFGTTKYCSAYLRGDACMNRNCMFLHEAGEAGESYSRADLSSMNAGSTQQGTGSKQAPPQSQQPMSAATPMVRTASDQPQSPTTDRPALPSTASWASRPMQTQPSRAESRHVSGSIDSPALPVATPEMPHQESLPAPATGFESRPAREPTPEPTPEPEFESDEEPTPQHVEVRKPRTPSPIRDLVKLFRPQDLCLEFSTANMVQSEIDILTSYPALFDSDGGAKRRLRRQKEEEQRRIELEQAAAAQLANVDADDNPEISGSMQLGGEPDEQDDLDSTRESGTAAGQDVALDQRFQFGGVSSPAGISERGLTPQQHQQLLLQTMKSPSPGSQGTYLNQSNAFQQGGHAPGHQRNVSRFSFANDSSASTAVKPVANQKLMSQQSAMMPPNGSNHFNGQQTSQSSQFFTSNVQGPPPGLKASGTPPVSGGMTFGQGHGFTTGGLQYGSNIGGRNINEDMMRDLLRGRNASVAGSDAAKRELHPYPYPNTSAGGVGYSTSPYPSSASAQYASSMSSFGGDGEKQRSKKKGKKHRHANTGSSSGAGLVDAVDGHLLQSRLQHSTHSGGQYMSTPPPPGGMYNPSIHGGSNYSGRWA